MLSSQCKYTCLCPWFSVPSCGHLAFQFWASDNTAVPSWHGGLSHCPATAHPLQPCCPTGQYAPALLIASVSPPHFSPPALLLFQPRLLLCSARACWFIYALSQEHSGLRLQRFSPLRMVKETLLCCCSFAHLQYRQDFVTASPLLLFNFLSSREMLLNSFSLSNTGIAAARSLLPVSNPCQAFL